MREFKLINGLPAEPYMKYERHRNYYSEAWWFNGQVCKGAESFWIFYNSDGSVNMSSSDIDFKSSFPPDGLTIFYGLTVLAFAITFNVMYRILSFHNHFFFILSDSSIPYIAYLNLIDIRAYINDRKKAKS